MIRNAKVKIIRKLVLKEGKAVGLARKSDCLDFNLNENETSMPTITKSLCIMITIRSIGCDINKVSAKGPMLSISSVEN